MAVDHRRLLSGRQTGPVAVLGRGTLWCASGLYQLAARYRRWQYDTGRRPVCRADVPVISVGNLTTGGTGKTPIVADLCRRLRARGRRVAIISRGYGAGQSGVNDEALELEQRLPDVPHVQHPDRVAAAEIAVHELEAEILVMDDGFQHRRLQRDLDLVVIDCTCPFGFGHLLPRGYLREPLSSLRRADAVILTRTDQVGEDELDTIRQTIRRFHPDAPVFHSIHRPAGLLTFDGRTQGLNQIEGKRVVMVSGIGNPDAFAETLRGVGADVIARQDLPDHVNYDKETRLQLRNTVAEIRPAPDWVICTQKDLVKLATDSIAGVPLACLQIELAYRDPPAWLEDRLDELSAPPR